MLSYASFLRIINWSPVDKLVQQVRHNNTWSGHYGSVCSDQTGLGFEPVWRTTHLLTPNRKQFDHLLYTKLKPVYQTDQTTLGCGLFGLVRPNICSLEIKMAATELFHEIHCSKINCFHRGSCFLLFRLDNYRSFRQICA